MKTLLPLAQMYIRFAIGIGFLFPVLDRIGVLGNPGDPNVGWGNWENFINYTNSLLPYLNRPIANFMGFAATVLELLFGILLIIGYKTRLSAYGSAVLTALFALSMLFFSGYRAPFTYSVFAASGGSLLLALIPCYSWSIDNLSGQKNK